MLALMKPNRMAYGTGPHGIWKPDSCRETGHGWRASKPCWLTDFKVESRFIALARAGIDARINGCMLRSVPHCGSEYQSVIHAGDEPCCKAGHSAWQSVD